MNILITGSEGFVGRNLVELFSKNKYTILAPLKDELDLTKFDDVSEYFRNNHIEIIIHCATTLREGTSYPTDTCQNNLRMFFNLQKQMTPAMKMINLGSGSEYGRKYWHKKMTEEYFDEHIPEDDHSYAKYLISKYIREVNNDNLICLRIFGIYGKYEDYRYKFISNAIVKNVLNMPIVISQNVIYDYIYINDFFKIVEYFVNNKAKNKIFNVTPTESIDLLAIANLINKVSENESEIRVLNEGIGVEYSGNNSKLLSEMGDFSFISPEAAIADLFKYYRSTKDKLDASGVREDAYLEYAKKLHTNYFSKKNEK